MYVHVRMIVFHETSHTRRKIMWRTSKVTSSVGGLLADVLKQLECCTYQIDPARRVVTVCVCVFIKLHITAQSGPVILVILCHSH